MVQVGGPVHTIAVANCGFHYPIHGSGVSTGSVARPALSSFNMRRD
jgi:hypothetical protein